MKFTIFEITIIYLLLGAVKQAPIQDIEKILKLRKAFKPTEKEDKLDEEGSDEIYTLERKIVITDEEKPYIYNIMCNPDLGLPVKEETLKLLRKLKPKEDKS